MFHLFAKKPLELILKQNESDTSLKRTLNAFDLIMIGIGAIIGAGLFIRTAAAAAEDAGPSVTLAYILAGVGCAFASLCYSEFASRIPIAGSAYTYSYATLGEFIAWIIGWDLILEYALGATTVAIGWSQYFNKLLGYLSLEIPNEWCHSPFEHFIDGSGAVQYGIVNLPAIFIILVISALLIRGISGSAFINNIIVIIKITIVLLFIIIGWQFINPENYVPFIPEPTIYVDSADVEHHFGGFEGILGAAGVVFFAFIGFDAVSTAAQETVNPKKALPIGILGSLVICTILYVLFSYVLTGVATTNDFRTAGKEASITYAVQTYMVGYEWLAKLVTGSILIGLSSVLLVFLLGQSRIFYSMSRDGLLPKIFAEVHPRFRTPYKSNILFACITSLLAGFVPMTVVGDMTSIGALFAYSLVCAAIIVLRRNHPTEDMDHFRTPFVPLIPILGIIVCGSMIYGLGYVNWIRLVCWMAIGLIVYFFYSRHHSEIQKINRS